MYKDNGFNWLPLR